MNRSVAVVCLFALALFACPKKEDAAADAATSATPNQVAPVQENDAAAVQPAPTLGGAAAKTATPTTPTTPKADAPADAGGATVADAGADTCCCEVAGQPFSQVGQSECVKTRKGACVKKDKCAAAPPPVVDAGPAPQQCCCDSGGKKALKGQSECTKGGAGKCVKQTECSK